jgi:hypothetical protein
MKKLNNLYQHQEFKKIYEEKLDETKFSSYDKILEAIDMSNSTQFSKSLIGRGINTVFSFFRKGIAWGVALIAINKIKLILNSVLVQAINQDYYKKNSFEEIKENGENIEEILSSIDKEENKEKAIELCMTKLEPLKDKMEEMEKNGQDTSEISDWISKLENKMSELNGEKVSIQVDTDNDEKVENKTEKFLFSDAFAQLFNDINALTKLKLLYPNDLKISIIDRNSDTIISSTHWYKIAKLSLKYVNTFDDDESKQDKEKIEEQIRKLEEYFQRYNELFVKEGEFYDISDTLSERYSDKKEKIASEYIDLEKELEKLIKDNNVNESVKSSKSKIPKSENVKGEFNEILKIAKNSNDIKEYAQKFLERRKYGVFSVYLMFLRNAGLDIPSEVRKDLTSNLTISEKDAQQANSYFEKKLFKLFDEYSDFFIDVNKVNPKGMIKDNNTLSGYLASDESKSISEKNKEFNKDTQILNNLQQYKKLPKSFKLDGKLAEKEGGVIILQNGLGLLIYRLKEVDDYVDVDGKAVKSNKYIILDILDEDSFLKDPNLKEVIGDNIDEINKKNKEIFLSYLYTNSKDSNNKQLIISKLKDSGIFEKSIKGLINSLDKTNQSYFYFRKNNFSKPKSNESTVNLTSSNGYLCDIDKNNTFKISTKNGEKNIDEIEKSQWDIATKEKSDKNNNIRTILKIKSIWGIDIDNEFDELRKKYQNKQTILDLKNIEKIKDLYKIGFRSMRNK